MKKKIIKRSEQNERISSKRKAKCTMYNKNYKEKVTFPHAPKFNTEASSYRDVQKFTDVQPLNPKARKNI